MGDLLEEAIREHLELKRSRGADPAEVARLEREALGPVQSAPTAEPTAEPGDAPADVALEPQAEVEPELDWEDAPTRLDSAAAPMPAPAQPAPAQPAPAQPYSHPEPDPELGLGDTQAFEPFADEHAPVDQQPTSISPEPAPPPASAAEPATAPQAPAPARPAPADQDWFAEDEPAPPPQPGHDPDLLEKTPEFLEETPEHDRLWFEQKPPRDFNFDK